MLKIRALFYIDSAQFYEALDLDFKSLKTRIVCAIKNFFLKNKAMVRFENYLSILVSLFFSKRSTTVQGLNCLVIETIYVLARGDADG